jgi:5'-3' exonuclease
MTFTLDPRNNLIFVDCSYFVFFRYYATLFWYKKQKAPEEVDIGGLINDSVFTAKYDKTFEQIIKSIVDQYNAPWENVVFARDCSRQDIWRHDIFNGYKGTRMECPTAFNGAIFKHTYDTLFPKLKEKYGFQVVEFPRLEADDIIAIMVQGIEERVQENNKNITIITDDNDYVQLIRPHVTIMNLKNVDIRTRIDDVERYLLTKIIMGDKSDNIPSIAKRCGPKTAAKLAKDTTELTAFIAKSGPEVATQYELNTRLIDFRYIPEHLSLNVISEMKWKT